jgi:hypothetical protein
MSKLAASLGVRNCFFCIEFMVAVHQLDNALSASLAPVPHANRRHVRDPNLVGHRPGTINHRPAAWGQLADRRFKLRAVRRIDLMQKKTCYERGSAPKLALRRCHRVRSGVPILLDRTELVS